MGRKVCTQVRKRVNGRMKSVKVCRQVYQYHPRSVAQRMRLSNRKSKKHSKRSKQSKK